MRPRPPVLLLALTVLLPAWPAAADEARFTPQPPPTARPIHATPAAPPREGPPLRPMAAFAPLPGGGTPSDPAPEPVRRTAAAPPKAEPPTIESPKAEPAPAPPPVAAPIPEPVPTPVPTPERASDPQTVAAPVRPPPRKPAVPSSAKRVWATEPVYVRAAPDPRARIVDGLVAGDALERLGVAEDGWVRVGRDGREIGYVAGRYLAAAPPRPDNGDGTCALPDDLPDRTEPVAPVGTVLRALAAANLRAAPACDARVLDVLDAGATVTVTGHADGWYEVRGRDLPRAFVGARLLGR